MRVLNLVYTTVQPQYNYRKCQGAEKMSLL